MFDTLVFAGSPNKDFFKHTRLWSLIKTYFSSSGMSTLNLQVSASSSIDSDNRALLFVRAKGSCSTDDVDSSSPENRGSIRVSVSGVKSLGGHFACLCQGFEFYEVKKKKFCHYFSKRKWKYFYTFNHLYSEKSSKRAK